MKRPAVSLLLSLCWLWVAGAAAQGVAPTSAQEEVFRITVKKSILASSDVDIPVHVFKPTVTDPNAGLGPWPVVIFSHGRSGSPAGRAAMKAPLAANSDAVRYWHARGYAVVSALRPGYGENTREDPEDHGVRWSGGTCNGQADFAKTTAAATLAMRSVHAWVVEQGWVAKNRILLVGQSVGGLTTVAACGQNWPGVMGCINFAGGAGGNPEASPAASCRPDAMEQQLANPGKSTTVPTLWLYSANDKFWGAEAPKQWHAAYRQAAAAAGQNAESEFFSAPPVGQDGHSLHSAGSRFWAPAVTAWLHKHGF